jgi:hypothetical protein
LCNAGGNARAGYGSTSKLWRYIDSTFSYTFNRAAILGSISIAMEVTGGDFLSPVASPKKELAKARIPAAKNSAQSGIRPHSVPGLLIHAPVRNIRFPRPPIPKYTQALTPVDIYRGA